MRQAGVAKTAVWRWQERFMLAGVGGLLRDKTRPSRIPPLAPQIAERVVALTLEPPPGETTHWTAPAMAKSIGISVSSVQRVWRAHGLQPHRLRQFKRSRDPHFAAKLRDIVGLYVDPPPSAAFPRASHAEPLAAPPMPWCCRWTRRDPMGVNSDPLAQGEIATTHFGGRACQPQIIRRQLRPLSERIVERFLSRWS
jgi:Homeodomain-like domain